VVLIFFHGFRRTAGLADIWPVPLLDLICFVAHLYTLNLSHSTVSCYISGMSFYHKVNDFEDTTQKFVIRKMIEGIKRSKSKRSDTRLPISRDLLANILNYLPLVCSSHYEAKLFMATFSLAFHGLMRVGELTVGNKSSDTHTISFHDVKISNNILEVFILSSKTNQLGKGMTLLVKAQADRNICPVALIANYLKDHPLCQGPLFCHFDGNPLTRYQFSALLKKSISVLDIEQKSYKSHSFRIGMATICSIEGMSDEQIKHLGRWKSDEAYLRYIRIPN
jgi:hypothetical protein